MRAAWEAIRFGAIATGRFVVRMLLDDVGKPATALAILWCWTGFTAGIYWHALSLSELPEAAGVIIEFVGFIELSLILWAAASKLGVGVFVPLAEAVAGALSRASSGLRDAVGRYGGGPSRYTPVFGPGGEISGGRGQGGPETSAAGEASAILDEGFDDHPVDRAGDHPLQDDERGDE